MKTDALHHFVIVQHIRFPYALDGIVHSHARNLEQLGSLPSGHPYIVSGYGYFFSFYLVSFYSFPLDCCVYVFLDITQAVGQVFYILLLFGNFCVNLSGLDYFWNMHLKRQGKADVYPSFSAFTVRIGPFTSLLHRPLNVPCF